MNQIMQPLMMAVNAINEKAASDARNAAILIELVQSFPRGRDCWAEDRWAKECKATLQKIVGSDAMEAASVILQRRKVSP